MKEEEIDKLTDKIIDVIWDYKYDFTTLTGTREALIKIGEEIKAILTNAIGNNNMNRRCRFFEYCVFASAASRTCINDAGGAYCGVYQELSKRGAKRKSWFSRLVKDVTK